MNAVLRRPGRCALGAVVVAVGAALVLAACGGGSSSSMPSGGVAGASKTMAGGHRVTAVESEYKIVLSQTTFSPGTYTFVAMNKGHVGHSLEIAGPGVSNRRIAGTVSPGSSKELTVTLQKGSYEVYCPIDSHKKLGMLDTIKVGGSGHGSAPASTSKSKSSWG